MAGKFVRSGNNTSLELEYEELSPMPEDTVEAAAHELWNRGGDHGTEEAPILFESLGEQDHVDILFDHAKRIFLDLAAQYVYNDAQALAIEAANSVIESTHSLGGSNEN